MTPPPPDVSGHRACPSVNRWLELRIRCLDRAAALVIGVLLAPVLGVLAWRVKRADGGPALVAVPRMGRDFRTFSMWKLRSMRTERSDGQAGGPSLTAANDDRITPIGKKLRSYHLDEIPQLWNVVRGEMLLLGPRPESPDFVSVSDPGWRAVLAVPPGIAGPTQMIVGEWERVHIADDPEGDAYPSTVVPVKLAIDQWYVESASPALDALTLVALAKRFLPGSHAVRMKRHARTALPAVVGPILDEERDTRDGNRRGRREKVRERASA